MNGSIAALRALADQLDSRANAAGQGFAAWVLRGEAQDLRGAADIIEREAALIDAHMGDGK